MTDDSPGPWRGRTGEFSPTYYAHKGPDATSEALRELLVEHVGRDVRVIELGCNVGRHLAHLHADGFTDLTGIDINADAIATLRETYPDLAADGEFLVADIGAMAADVPKGEFDAVYAVETLQHLPPEDDALFDDIAAMAGSLLLTVENEGSVDGRGYEVTHVNDEIPLYHRDWATVFEARGFEQVTTRDHGRDTLRAFVRA